jgi:hypothetical protein
MVTMHPHPTIELPERMRTCDHSWSPLVHQIKLKNSDDTVSASRCLRCGVWLTLPQHHPMVTT